MKTITALKIQKRDKNRVNLFLDNKYFCALELETTLKNSLKVGTIITEEKLVEIQLESEKQSALTKALKLVSTRYKTQREVERYLYEKGYVSQIVYYVLSKLLEYHYIDDERYVASFVSAHKNTCGKLKIKQQLLQKGVSESLIDSALNDDEFEQDDEIKRLAEKYMKSKEDTKENYIKLFRYLMSKGFEYDEIKRVLKKDVEWHQKVTIDIKQTDSKGDNLWNVE